MINYTDSTLVICGGSDKNCGRDRFVPDISDDFDPVRMSTDDRLPRFSGISGIRTIPKWCVTSVMVFGLANYDGIFFRDILGVGTLQKKLSKYNLTAAAACHVPHREIIGKEQQMTGHHSWSSCRRMYVFDNASD
jgi:hypothetical protein